LLLASGLRLNRRANHRVLKERGVDVIVIDHHQISSPAGSGGVVNPQLFGCDSRFTIHDSRFTELCSAGLAFKLAHALVKRGRETNLPGAAEFDLRPLLDLVALGTIADIVPLTGENRILVSAGLERFEHHTRPGPCRPQACRPMRAPAREDSRHEHLIESRLQLGPGSSICVSLLCTSNRRDLAPAARRDEAEALLIAQAAGHCAIASGKKSSAGIAEEVSWRAAGEVQSADGFCHRRGSVALAHRRRRHRRVGVLSEFYRPTIIVGGEGSVMAAGFSGRSIAGFDLAAALRECDDLLHSPRASRHGRRLTFIRPARRLRQRLNELAAVRSAGGFCSRVASRRGGRPG